MINAMHNIKVGVSEHLYIMYIIDFYLRIKYTERILRGPAIKKFLHVLLECKESANGLAGYQFRKKCYHITVLDLFQVGQM